MNSNNPEKDMMAETENALDEEEYSEATNHHEKIAQDEENKNEENKNEENGERLNQEPEEDQAIETAKEETTPLDELPVHINFELGSIELPLHALKNISQGYIFTDLNTLSLSKAYAKTGSRVFAQGEFVDIGGKMGFRITQLYGAHQK